MYVTYSIGWGMSIDASKGFCTLDNHNAYFAVLNQPFASECIWMVPGTFEEEI